MTATQIQFRRGSAAQMATFTGAQGEVVVDTTNNRVVVHDGATAGGWPMAGLNAANTWPAPQQFATSITSPVLYGGSAASSTLTLTSTSNGSPSGDKVLIRSGGATRWTLLGNGNIGVGTETNPQYQLVVSASAATGITLQTSLAAFVAADGNSTNFSIASFGTGVNSGVLQYGARGTYASPSASQSGDVLGFYAAKGYAATTWDSAIYSGVAIFAAENHTATANGTNVQILTVTPGGTTRASVATFQSGIQVGSPTGGDKGAGTINVASNIYLNNTAYTNPDYALEHYFTGKIERFAKNRGAASYRGLTPLDELRAQLRATFRLPGITNEPAGVVERHDIALEKIEEAILYILELDQRLTAQETQLSARSWQ